MIQGREDHCGSIPLILFSFFAELLRIGPIPIINDLVALSSWKHVGEDLIPHASM